jgi:hypothetical protein
MHAPLSPGDRRLDHVHKLTVRGVSNREAAPTTAPQGSGAAPSFETVRRETGKEYEVKVLYSEGVANHTDPEPCVRPVRSRAKRR